jgi:uncharacterized membrane protein YfcA
LGIYFSGFQELAVSEYIHIILPATLSAIAGATIGNRLLKKVTIRFLQTSVSILLVAVSLALALGLI